MFFQYPKRIGIILGGSETFRRDYVIGNIQATLDADLQIIFGTSDSYLVRQKTLFRRRPQFIQYSQVLVELTEFVGDSFSGDYCLPRNKLLSVLFLIPPDHR